MYRVVRFRGKAYWRKIFLTALAIIAAMVIALAAFSYNSTPRHAVNRGYAGSAYEFAKQLALIDMQGGKQLCVYLTAPDNVAVALVRKGLLGYRLIGLSGTLPKQSPEAQLSMASGFSGLVSSDMLNWGILYADDIKEVQINGHVAKLVPIEQIGRCWCFIAPSNYIEKADIRFIDTAS